MSKSDSESRKLVNWFIHSIISRRELEIFKQICGTFPVYIDKSILSIINVNIPLNNRQDWNTHAAEAIAMDENPTISSFATIHNLIMAYMLGKHTAVSRNMECIVNTFPDGFEDYVPNYEEINKVVRIAVVNKDIHILEYMNSITSLSDYFNDPKKNMKVLNTHMLKNGNFELHKCWVEELGIDLPKEIDYISQLDSQEHLDWLMKLNGQNIKIHSIVKSIESTVYNTIKYSKQEYVNMVLKYGNFSSSNIRYNIVDHKYIEVKPEPEPSNFNPKVIKMSKSRFSWRR